MRQEGEASWLRHKNIILIGIGALIGGLGIGAFGTSLTVIAPAIVTSFVSPAASLELSAKKTSSLAVVDGAYKTWGAGGFVGSEAKANAAKYFTEDAIIDFSAAIDRPVYKVYHGTEGALEFIQNLLVFKFIDFTPTLVMGPGGSVIAKNTYESVLLSTLAHLPHQVDLMEYVVSDGKISRMKAFFGDQRGTAKLFATETVAPVAEMMKAWASGEFNGPNAKEVARTFFTEDALTDATAEIQGTDKYKKYYGTDGVVEWCKFLGSFNFLDFTPELFEGPEPGTVVMAMTYGLESKVTGKSTPSRLSDVALMKVVDRKVSDMKFYWGSPAAIERILN